MMFTTARQMETWAHSQDIYDLLGKSRNNTDRLKNIAVIGVRTYGWTFVNRKLEPPGPAPYVKLTAPSGDIWEFNDPSTDNYVEGSAVEFCHVVTQGRNIADVNLTVTGEPAEKWMSIAQCFAGPPGKPSDTGVTNGFVTSNSAAFRATGLNPSGPDQFPVRLRVLRLLPERQDPDLGGSRLPHRHQERWFDNQTCSH